MAKECQVLLTFTQRGRLASKGANSATKAEIKKMLRFKGDVDPTDGKWKPVLNLDYYLKNKLPFPKGYWWSKSEYQEPKPSIVQRKLRWTWEQVSEMVKVPVGMSERQWSKLSFKDKVRLHGQRCMMEGEEKVEIEYIY
jgi:hypothetical protein